MQSSALALALLTLTACVPSVAMAADGPVERSGIYPHLAYYNDERECGTGAVVPWAGRLWVITYAPHAPKGSSDKLYEIDDQLTLTIRPESIGGTPANRMIHDESQQLFIGPYAIDAQRKVRVIPPSVMPGRLTGNARHLTDPAGRIYVATMEEGFYEIDVKSLAVTTLFPDMQDQVKGGTGTGAPSLLPGYHGKGLYSGQGRLVYANNGEVSEAARRDPRTVSGVLAEYDGTTWTQVLRKQFTEVTGPGGIHGNADPAKDPIWSVGWDHRSLLLMLRDGGAWHAFRLPKASASYDGAHGWNTEWPRIRDVGAEGQPDLLMTMHGMFWRFPRGFTAASRAGIRPRSSYLKVIGDFCRWNGRLVFGCDDSAASEFLNKRKVKGEIAGPEKSHSNLWFTAPEAPDRLGSTAASGGPWLEDAVQAGIPSDPFLFAGWERRALWLVNRGAAAVSITIEVDKAGDGAWSALRTVAVPAGATQWTEFAAAEAGEWVRLVSDRDTTASAWFTYGEAERAASRDPAIVAGMARIGGGAHTSGLIRARAKDRRVLQLAAMQVAGDEASDIGYYELDAALALRRVKEPESQEFLKEKVAIPREVLTLDAGSVLVVDDRKRRWRLPRGAAAYDAATAAGLLRIDREIATERDLFSCHGTFYELPAENADGYAKMRPVASHDLQVMDYCSYRGLLVMTGVAGGEGNPHVIRSDDGKAAVWAGAIDDLWKLGKPRGQGGPWKDSAVVAGTPSDPYLFWGYDSRSLTLSHQAAGPVAMRVELDLTGNGLWVPYQRFVVEPGKPLEHRFPAGVQARWLRVVSEGDATATAWLVYE